MGTYYDDDDDGVEISDPGNLGRVRHVSPGGCEVFVDLPSGQTVTATSSTPFQLSAGDVVMIHGQSIERVGDELWPEEAWVGVIKLKLKDVTVVDGGGRWRLLPTALDVEYSVGNTVEVLPRYANTGHYAA